MFTLEYMDITGCIHSEDCECIIRIKGKQGTVMEGVQQDIQGGKGRCARITEFLLRNFSVVEGQVVRRQDAWKEVLLHRLQRSPNMEVVPAPILQKAVELETPSCSLPPEIAEAWKYADRQVLPQYYENIDFNVLFSPNEQVDEYHQEIRLDSPRLFHSL